MLQVGRKGRPVGPFREPGSVLLAYRDVIRPDHFVGARRPVDPIGHAVEIHQVEEEDPGRVLAHPLLDLGEDRLTLLPRRTRISPVR